MFFSFFFLHSIPSFLAHFLLLLLLLSPLLSLCFFPSSLAFLFYLVLGTGSRPHICYPRVLPLNYIPKSPFPFYFETKFSLICLNWSWPCTVAQTSLWIMIFLHHLPWWHFEDLQNEHYRLPFCAIGCIRRMKEHYVWLNRCDQINNGNNLKDLFNLILQNIK